MVKLETKKVVLMGLSNSGKSSIALCLQGIKNLPAFNSLIPTKGYEIKIFNFLNTAFRIWDFGGQEQYREEQLDSFQANIKGTDKFIFVIDVQNLEEYDLALEYLGRVSKKIHESDLSIEFSIFLHKYDPDIEKTYPEITDEVIDGLITKIDKTVNNELEYSIFKTTIFTTFQKIKI